MLAISLTVGLFAFWWVLGYAALAWLRPEGRGLPNALLAPVLGFTLTLLPVFFFNTLGVPVGRLGWPLAVAMPLAAVALLWRGRAGAPPRVYALFAAVLVLALALTGRPMLHFGFDWLSYCNGDMANYCLRAHRFLDHGFDDVPDLTDFVTGRDYGLMWWFMDVSSMTRPGSDLVLSWVMSVTGLNAHQAFMPVILAFHLLLISTTGALICRPDGAGGAWWMALLACLLTALSALTTLGALYQLFAQVPGLALLAGCLDVLLRPYGGLSRGDLCRRGVLVGLLLSGLLTVYPEVLPFLAASCGIYFLVGWRRGWVPLRPLAGVAGVTLLTAVLLLTRYTAFAVLFMADQASAGNRFPALMSGLFPYYLIPSGLAHLWGFQAIGGALHEPWQTVAVCVGGALLLLGAWAAARLTRLGQPAGIMTLVMLLLAVWLRMAPQPFGLFKLAMFLQPFLLATLVLAWCGAVRRPALRLAPLLALGLAGLATQAHYVKVSRGNAATLIEIPNPSGSRLLREFAQKVHAVPAKRVVVDSYNVSLATLQAVYVKGVETAFPCVRFVDGSGALFHFGVKKHFHRQAVIDATCKLWRLASDTKKWGAFDLHDPAAPGRTNPFHINEMGRVSQSEAAATFLACGTPRVSAFNRRHFAGAPGNFAVRPWPEVHDHLFFTTSQLGGYCFTVYDFAHSSTRYAEAEANPQAQENLDDDSSLRVLEGDELGASFYQLEPDLAFRGSTMAGCGRHLLFEVANPSPTVRLLLEMTETWQGDGENRLPPAAAVGAERVPLPLRGRGSARVFSPPLHVQEIRGHYFVAVDLGRDGVKFPSPRQGVMALYGKQYGDDRRQIVGFLRDVSLVSEAEHAALAPPAALATFPDDLRHPDLEYSGAYEDGWLSESSFFNLGSPGGSAELVVRGTVPLIGDNKGFTAQLRVLVDGEEVKSTTLPPGAFAFRCPVTARAGARHVELLFSAAQRLGAPDNRPVGAHLDYLGLEPAAGR